MRASFVLRGSGQGLLSLEQGQASIAAGRRAQRVGRRGGQHSQEPPRLLCFSVSYRAGPASEARGRWRREDLGCREFTTRRLLSSAGSGASQPGGVWSWSRGEAVSGEVCPCRGGGRRGGFGVGLLWALSAGDARGRDSGCGDVCEGAVVMTELGLPTAWREVRTGRRRGGPVVCGLQGLRRA